MINFEVLSIPAPFVVGPVNAYLIKNDPVTLIDCGPNSIESKAALNEQLLSFGLALENIRQIIITHAHSDHYGMAAEIQRISGAAVYMHNKEILKTRYRLKYQENVVSYLAYAGAPEVHCQKLTEHFARHSAETPVEITGVEDGQTFSFDDCQLEVVLTAGHSAGHISLFERNEGLLFAGDTVLEKVKQKPLVEPFFVQPLQREKNIVQYISSLNLIKQMKISRILPGHGKPVFNVGAVLQQLEMNLQKRKEEINEIADELKVFSPFDLTVAASKGLRNPLDVIMAVSEILGYLDVLETEGKVIQIQNKQPLTYCHL